MIHSAVSSVSAESAAASHATDTRLRGRWLVLARVGWIVAALLTLVLAGLSIPATDTLLQSVCQPGAQCITVQLRPDDVRELHQLSLSPGFLAAMSIVQSIILSTAYCALGALLFWRRSHDRMALFGAYTLILFGGVGGASVMQYGLALVSPAWYALYGVLQILGQTAFLTFLLLFPSGRFVPHWTRWCLLPNGLLWVYNVFFYDSYHNAGPGPVWSNVLTLSLLLVGVGAQVYRYWRISTRVERQQTKWVVFAFSVAISAFALTILLGNIFLPPAVVQSAVAGTLILGNISLVLFLLIPIAIVVAILRYHLWDIDTIINKALVYGSLTGILGALYAGLIIGLTSLVGTITGTTNQPIVLVIATLAIAALFHPARHRIQSLIDRRFFRKKYDAEKILAAFSTTLRNEVDLEQLHTQILAVVQETIEPAHVSLWLRQPERHPTDFAHRLEPHGQVPSRPNTD